MAKSTHGVRTGVESFVTQILAVERLNVENLIRELRKLDASLGEPSNRFPCDRAAWSSVIGTELKELDVDL